MSNFEKFTQKKFKSATKPLATITKDKLLNFNAAAMINTIKDMQYAVLYYDRGNSLIGIKFTNKSTPEAYRIRKFRRDKLGIISVTSFLRYYNIEHPKTLTYTMEWDAEENMNIIDLKEHRRKKENEVKKESELPL